MGYLGTYNPLPKALHGCDRRNFTSGGADVWRGNGSELGCPRCVRGEVATRQRQCRSNGDMRTRYRKEEGVSGSDRHETVADRRSCWGVESDGKERSTEGCDGGKSKQRQGDVLECGEGT
jgi:hypothetical protein